MLRGMFRRFFCQFRESAVVHTKFVTSGTTTTVTFAPKSTRARSSYPGMTLARTGVGLYSLTVGSTILGGAVAGGAREIAILGIEIMPAAAGRRGLRFEMVAPGITESTGVITLQSVNGDGSAISDAITATDEVHVTLLVDK